MVGAKDKGGRGNSSCWCLPGAEVKFVLGGSRNSGCLPGAETKLVLGGSGNSGCLL